MIVKVESKNDREKPNSLKVAPLVFRCTLSRTVDHHQTRKTCEKQDIHFKAEAVTFTAQSLIFL